MYVVKRSKMVKNTHHLKIAKTFLLFVTLLTYPLYIKLEISIYLYCIFYSVLSCHSLYQSTVQKTIFHKPKSISLRLQESKCTY